MKAYKGFDKDLKCLGHQYKIGGEYNTDRVELCKAGFHACANPLDCMSYYSPNDGCVYHEVEVDGEIQRSNNDSKIAAAKIKIGAKISIAGIVKGAINFVFGRPTSGVGVRAATSGYDARATTSGDCAYAATSENYAHAVASGCGAHAATLGDYAHAVTSGSGAHAATLGDYAHAATSGNSAHAATSGYGAHATTSGYGAHAEVKGNNSIAAVLGYGCMARGATGCWLVLAERGNDGSVLDVRAVKVDGEKVKSDTWYELRDGDVVEGEV